MRDPRRIDRILLKLRRIWHGSPDLRLAQLVVNLAVPKEPCPEVFYFEDDKLENQLDKIIKDKECQRTKKC